MATTVKEINEAKDFYDFLLSTGLQNTSYESFDFFTKYQNINKGCSCQKKNRIKRAESAYLSAVTSSSAEFQELMKQAAEVDTIRFFTEHGLFFEI